MSLVIFNGSPRNKKSNSKILIEEFLKGYEAVNKSAIEVNYLKSNSDKKKRKGLYQIADQILIIFPLYCDSMPGIVMEFLEEIHIIGGEGKKIGFIVQSGFPEAKQSEAVSKYLRKFTKRIGAEYLGCVIKGGVEGIQIMHPKMTEKLFNNFKKLGKTFGLKGELDREVIELLGTPYRLSAVNRFFYRIASAFGLSNFYWNMMLKKHGAYEKRFNKPYINSH